MLSVCASYISRLNERGNRWLGPSGGARGDGGGGDTGG